MQASLKKFMDYIQTSAVDKMTKFLDKGLDPNYQDSDTGGKESREADERSHLLCRVLPRPNTGQLVLQLFHNKINTIKRKMEKIT